MNVSLTPELRDFVNKKVESGLYQSASEVVREGLRLLAGKEQRASFHFNSPAELKAKLQEGIDQLEKGEGIRIEGEEALESFFEDIKSSGRKRLKSDG